jgi:hypothetical protein
MEQPQPTIPVQPTPRDPKEVADELRAEAKRILKRLLKLGPQDGTTNGMEHFAVDRFVDCIVSVSILETTALMKVALKGD